MAAPGIRLFTKEIFEVYTKEFGERKACTLLQSLGESSLLIKTIQLWDKQNHVPTYQDLQKVVGAINWFTFSRRETTALGMLAALSLWDGRVNNSKKLVSDLEVTQIGFSILNWLKVYLVEVEIWQQEFIAYLLARQALKTPLVKHITNGCKISNIQHMSYNIVQGNIFRTKKIIPSEISIYAEIGAPIKGGIFVELPDIILDTLLSGYDTAGNFYRSEPDTLEFFVSDKFLITDTEVKIEIATPDTIFQRDYLGRMVAIPTTQHYLECNIDKNGICVISQKLNWTFIFGGNVNDWTFSQYSL